MRKVIIPGIATCDASRIEFLSDDVAFFIETIPTERIQYGPAYSRQVRENLNNLIRFANDPETAEIYKKRITLQLAG